MTALAAADVEDALGWIRRHADRERPPLILIMGSLYLAGETLRKNGQTPV
jgi:dihydrofolate synthase/folylpolyglutamate synthase